MSHDAHFNWAVPSASAHIIYQLRHDDASGELFEAATLDAVMDSIIDDGGEFNSATFDALVVSNARIETKAQQLGLAFNRAAGVVKLVDNGVTVTKPFKQNGSTQIVMLFEMSDGQTITVYLHNPDVKPNQLQATDVLISWKWLLNRKDITIVVAPENGKDLALAQVASRIMALLDKNSARFTKANAGRAARLELIAGLQAQVSEREATLQGLIEQLDTQKSVRMAVSIAQSDTQATSDWYVDSTTNERRSLLFNGLHGLRDTGWEVDSGIVAYKYYTDPNKSQIQIPISATVEASGRWLEATLGSGATAIADIELRGLSPKNLESYISAFNEKVDAWILSQGVSVVAHQTPVNPANDLSAPAEPETTGHTIGRGTQKTLDNEAAQYGGTIVWGQPNDNNIGVHRVLGGMFNTDKLSVADILLNLETGEYSLQKHGFAIDSIKEAFDPVDAQASTQNNEVAQFLQSVVDGKVDFEERNLGDQLTALYPQTVNDEALSALFKQAVEAFASHALRLATSTQTKAS